jgi:hypothetical protein
MPGAYMGEGQGQGQGQGQALAVPTQSRRGGIEAVGYPRAGDSSIRFWKVRCKAGWHRTGF